MTTCPVCGTRFDSLESYENAHGSRSYTGRPRQWCSKYCRNVARYRRLKDRGYYDANAPKRQAQARARHPHYVAIRDRLRADRRIDKRGT